MSPRVACQARAYGELGTGTDGAGRPRRGASGGCGRRFSRSAGTGGPDFAPPCRGPPPLLLSETRKTGRQPGLPTHRRLPAPDKISTGSVARSRPELRSASRAAPVRPRWWSSRAPRLRCWRWLSAISTSARREPRPGATTHARAGRRRRLSAAAEWTARGSCRYAAVTAASCPSTSPSVSIRWPATSPPGFSPGRSCRRGSAASPPPP